MTRASWRADPSADIYDEIRTQVVDAAEYCARRVGPAKLRIDDVAKRAGVSRATIYRYFTNKDDLLHGVLLRKASALAATLTDAIAELGDPSAMIVEGILIAKELIENDPFFEPFLYASDTATTTRVAGRSTDLKALIARALEPAFTLAEAAGILRAGVTAADAAEWTFLVTYALVTIPSSEERSLEEQRGYLRRMMLPSLLELPSPS